MLNHIPQAWRKDGKLHREDGPAVIYTDGAQVWYKDGKRHREGGPAVIDTNGDQVWYVNDRFHREDGPAVIKADGSTNWCIDDVEYSFTEWCDLLNISEADKMYYKIKYQIIG